MIFRVLPMFLGNSAIAAARWAFFVATTKLVRLESGTRWLEDLTLSMAIVGPLFILLGGGLRHIIAVSTCSSPQFQQLVRQRALAGVGACLAAVAATVLTGQACSFSVLMAFCALRFSEAMSELAYGLMQSRNLFQTISILKALRAFVAIACFPAALIAGLPFPVSLGLVAAVWWTLAICLEMPLAHSLCVGADTGRMKEHGAHVSTPPLSYGMALSCAMAIISLATGLPAYFLAVVQPDALALYGSLLCFVTAQQMAYVSYGQCLLPQLAQKWRAHDYSAIRQSLASGAFLILASAMLVTALLSVGGPFVLNFVYNGTYAVHGPILCRMLLAGGVTGVFSLYGSALTAAGIYRPQLVVSGAYVGAQGLALALFSAHLSLDAIAFSSAVAGAASTVAAVLARRACSAESYLPVQHSHSTGCKYVTHHSRAA